MDEIDDLTEIDIYILPPGFLKQWQAESERRDFILKRFTKQPLAQQNKKKKKQNPLNNHSVEMEEYGCVVGHSE